MRTVNSVSLRTVAVLPVICELLMVTVYVPELAELYTP